MEAMSENVSDNDSSDGEGDENVCPWEGCDRSFGTVTGVKVHHTKAHDQQLPADYGDTEYNCPAEGCSSSFPTDGGMKIHYAGTHDESLVDQGDVCCLWEGCDRTFRTELGMKQHHVRTHGESLWGELFTCAYCGAEGRMRGDHMQRNERTFCDKECHGEWIQENRDPQDYPGWGDGTTVECTTCGASKRVAADQLRRYDNHFCDGDCYAEYRSDTFWGQNCPAWRGNSSSIRNTVVRAIGNESWTTTRKCQWQEGEQVCEMEGCEATPESDGRRLSIHHIIAVMDGGCNADPLLMKLCNECHQTAEAFVRQFTDPVLTDYTDAELPEGRMPSREFLDQLPLNDIEQEERSAHAVQATLARF